jgi:hydroxymethylpyrimidine kinase/phosphomethylpyrimidine kinase/thiamine-phosphate diphosphorylase
MSIRQMVLNFSGNDTAGLAGLAMDVKVQNAFEVHSAVVITANTAQNNEKVISINCVADAVFQDQLDAVDTLPITAVKVGLIGSITQAEQIKNFVQEKKLPLILDPVIASSSGAKFIDDNFILFLKEQLLPHTTLLTPNIMEAEVLANIKIKTTKDIVTAAAALLVLGVNAVLIKGGHFADNSSDNKSNNNIDHTQENIVQDYFSDGTMSFWLSNQKIATQNSRGTGCALASAVASSIALGYSLYDAVVIAKMAISQGLRQAYAVEDANFVKGIAQSYGPVNITHFPCDQIDLPLLTHMPVDSLAISSFPECNQPLLGLYPVVDRAEWITRLVSTGVTTIQLRVKDLLGDELEREIKRAIELGVQNNCRLFINDHWQLAIKYNAYGVHLGQEDLADANISEIKKAGLRLGLSTHCHYEVARAHSYKPSYIACGPVFHTTTKDMPWVPHGLKGLSYWRGVLNYPLVAIGGINTERFESVAATGVDSVAMITAITLAQDPRGVAAAYMKKFEDAQA